MNLYIKSLACSILLTSSLLAQEYSCKSIKTGKFILLDSIEGNTKIWRKGKIQIEKGCKSGLKLKLKVSWLDECHYKLELIKIKSNPNNISIPKDICLVVEVIEVGMGYYYESSSANISDKKIFRKIIIRK